MVLAVLSLDVKKAKTISAIQDPNIFHGASGFCFHDGRKRKFWNFERIGTCLMILSQDGQDLYDFGHQFGLVSRSPSRMDRAEKDGSMSRSCDFNVTGTKRFEFKDGKERIIVARPTVAFESSLIVTDENAFVKVLKNGSGKRKAFGMGSMTVAPA